MTLCIVAGSTLASRAVNHVGPKPMLVAGMVFQTIGLIGFTRISPGGSYLGEVLVPSLFVAIGIGLAFVPVTIAAVAGVADSEAGLASGLVNTSRLVGGALGLAVLAAIATSRTDSEVRHGASAGVSGARAAHAGTAEQGADDDPACARSGRAQRR